MNPAEQIELKPKGTTFSKKPITAVQFLLLPIVLCVSVLLAQNHLGDAKFYSGFALVSLYLKNIFLYLLTPLLLWYSPSLFRKRITILIGEEGLLETLTMFNKTFFLTHVNFEEVSFIQARIRNGKNHLNSTGAIKFGMRDGSKFKLLSLTSMNEILAELNKNDNIASNVIEVGNFRTSKISSNLKSKPSSASYESQVHLRSQQISKSYFRGRRVLNFARVISMIIVIYFLMTTAFFGQDIEAANERTNQINLGIDFENYLELNLKITDINALTKLAEMQILPAPAGRFGHSVQNGWYPNDQTFMDIASAKRVTDLQQSNEYIFDTKLQSNISTVAESTYGDALSKCDFAGSDPITGEPTCFILSRPRDSVKYYPFDEYHFQFPILNVVQRISGGETEEASDDQFLSVPIKIWDATGSLRNWNVTINPVSQYKEVSFDDHAKIDQELNSGNANVLVIANRDRYTVLLVLIVVLLMIASMISVILMGVSVALRYRPPTVQALVWAAALTFSLIQLRTLLPDSPPVGTYLDIVFYFPALLVTIGGSIWILFHWIRRSDYGI